MAAAPLSRLAAAITFQHVEIPCQVSPHTLPFIFRYFAVYVEILKTLNRLAKTLYIISVCIHGSTTATASCRYSLTIYRIRYVATSEYPWDIGFGCRMLDFDVTLSIAFYVWAEDVAVWVMPYGEKKSIDSKVLTCRKVSSLYPICTI